jgi:hypothetical protein
MQPRPIETELVDFRKIWPNNRTKHYEKIPPELLLLLIDYLSPKNLAAFFLGNKYLMRELFSYLSSNAYLKNLLVRDAPQRIFNFLNMVQAFNQEFQHVRMDSAPVLTLNITGQQNYLSALKSKLIHEEEKNMSSTSTPEEKLSTIPIEESLSFCHQFFKTQAKLLECEPTISYRVRSEGRGINVPERVEQPDDVRCRTKIEKLRKTAEELSVSVRNTTRLYNLFLLARKRTDSNDVSSSHSLKR